MHPHKFLKTKIRNVLRRWRKDQGSTIILLIFQNAEIATVCLRTKITNEIFAEGALAKLYHEQRSLVTWLSADHKILNEECELRNNHRHAVVVQDLAIWWIQVYPCESKTSQETEKCLRNFLEPSEKPQVIDTDNSLEFAKSSEDLSWNLWTSTPHGSEMNGIAERAVRRVKEGTSAVFLQSGFYEQWWSDSIECYCFCETFKTSYGTGKLLMKGDSVNHSRAPQFHLEHWLNITQISTRDQMRIHQFGKKVLPGIFLGYALIAGGLCKGDFLIADLEEL